MESTQIFEKSKSIIIKYALYSTLLYIAYFAIMRIAGLAPYVELRFLNYFLYFIVGYYGLSSLRKLKNGALSYTHGLGIAFAIGALSFLFYGLFIFLYSYFDSFFVNTILNEFPSAIVFGRFGAPFLVASEGIGLSSILALCLMQYFQVFANRKRSFLFFGPRRESSSLPY